MTKRGIRGFTVKTKAESAKRTAGKAGEASACKMSENFEDQSRVPSDGLAHIRQREQQKCRQKDSE